MSSYATNRSGGGGSGGGGTVTSVGLADGSLTPIYVITNSPVTTAGTLTFTLTNQPVNQVFAGPSFGGAGQPTFRALVPADIPTGNLTDTGTDGIVITSGNGAVVGSGTIIAQHVADATHNGYLSSGDWSTFNAKQPAGNYITALTGDGTATGPGSVAFTLATVNGNVGSFGTATQVGTFTVNAKGLITAASNTSIQIAESQVTNLVSDLAGKQPIGNYITALTGDVTASGPGSVAASLTAITNSTITTLSALSLPFSQTTGTVGETRGGTSQTTYAIGDTLYASAANTLAKRTIGNTGDVLTVSGGVPVWIPNGASAPTSFILANNQTSLADVTGFLVNPAVNHAFNAEISVERYNTSAPVYTDDSAYYTNLGSSFNQEINNIAIQADQKSVIGGVFTSFNGNTRNRLVRLNSDGTEDTSFYTNLGAGFNDVVKWVIVQADQKIVIVGDFTSFNSNTRNRIVRLNSDGTEDTSFYTNVGTGFASLANIVREQSNNQLVIGGTFTSFNSNTRNRLVRLNSDGTEDTSFYTNLGTGFGANTFSILIQADQKIVVGGLFTSFNSNTRNGLVRLNSDGTEDASFYTNLGTGFGSTVFTSALQADQKILAGGTFTTFNGNTRNHIVRLNTDGTEDTSFYTNLGSGFNNSVLAIEMSFGQNILIGGSFTTLNGAVANKAAVLNPSGTRNLSFQWSFDSSVFTFATQTNNQILIGGLFSTLNGNSRVFLDRYITLSSQSNVVQNTIRGVYNVVSTTWTIIESGFASSSIGVTFNMTNSGQLQYTTSNFFGTVVTSVMKFIVTGL